MKVFKNDLVEWKKLTVSTMMQKPFEILIDHPKIAKLQEKNLTSAICTSCLLNLGEKDGQIEICEKDLFYSIANIPHISNIHNN